MIRALRPAVDREHAVDLFARGLVGSARRVVLGPLRSVADVYLPFRLYQVTVERGVNREACILGLDSITGALDLYRFDGVPSAPDVIQVCTGNHPEPAVSARSALDILESRVKRMAYQRFGFMSGRIRVDMTAIEGELHVPYWVGFFGRGEAASMPAIMAASRRASSSLGATTLIVSCWRAVITAPRQSKKYEDSVRKTLG